MLVLDRIKSPPVMSGRTSPPCRGHDGNSKQDADLETATTQASPGEKKRNENTYHQKPKLHNPQLRPRHHHRNRLHHQHNPHRPDANDIQHRHRVTRHPERMEIITDNPRPLQRGTLRDLRRPGYGRIEGAQDRPV